MFVKYLEGVWQKNKCGGFFMFVFIKKKKKRIEEKKKNRKERLYTKKIKSFLSFSLRVWLEVLKESLESLSSYKSHQKNCLQCSLELVFSYSFVSIALSLSLITSNKSPLDLSFAIFMIVEK